MCNTKQDPNDVHAFLQKVLNVLKIKCPVLQKCVYFREGAGSQYKNYKALSNLCHHESDSGLKAEWNFFATYHGKNLYDGIGVTIKRSHVSLWSLQEPINTLSKMFECSGKNINAINLYLFICLSRRSRDSHCRLWFRRKVGTLGWHCLEQEVSVGISLAVKYNFKCIMSHLMM